MARHEILHSDFRHSFVLPSSRFALRRDTWVFGYFVIRHYTQHRAGVKRRDTEIPTIAICARRDFAIAIGFPIC